MEASRALGSSVSRHSRMAADGRPNLGGMEKAFSMNIIMLIVRYFAGAPRIDINRESAPTTKQRRKRKKSGNSTGDRVWGAWAILPNELLVSVIMKLDIISYLAFSGVCRSWKLASTDIHKCFMERLQPLVLVRQKYCKKACLLYNMFDGRISKSMLPNLPCMKFWQLVSGYLTTIDYRGVWLVNLMTRHELRFPVLPPCNGNIYDKRNRAVLFRSTQISGAVMIVFSRINNYLLMSESGATRWKKYSLPEGTRNGVLDVKILDGRIFVLTGDLRLAEFNPRRHPLLKFYNIEIPLQRSPFLCLQLATSDNKLYAIVSVQVPPLIMKHQYVSLYELDYKTGSVKQILDLGSKSLFLSECQSAVVDTTGWGAGNCVCFLRTTFDKSCSFFSLNGRELANVPFMGNDNLTPYCWFFPSESWDIDYVGNEFGMHFSF